MTDITQDRETKAEKSMGHARIAGEEIERIGLDL